MSNLGASFKRARESSGLPLEKIAAETRISTRFLAAIENEEFHVLPGGVFNRGFIRTYAERVGLNPEQALADYDRISSAVEEPVEVLRNVERASMRKSERSLYPIAGGLLAVLVIVFYVVTRNGSTGSAAEPATPAAPPPVSAAAPATEAPVTAPAPLPEPEVIPAPAPPVETQPLVLDFDVSDLSWIKIITDGTVALSDNVQAGSKQHFTAKSTIDVMIGNAGGASFAINGRNLGLLGKSGEVRQVTITPENAATIK
jgi:cytoskeletal protein RodZ